jgi:hypothetical protein
MMIGDEKAPAFSAKTLNLPVPPNDLTPRIIALSRERYSKERAEVEQLVRKNAGLAIDEPSHQPAPQPAKPHVQAQVAKLDDIAAQEAKNQPLKLGGLLGPIVGSAPEAAESQPAKKRRRGKRGGKKNKTGGANPIIQPSGQASGNDHEEVIHLR